MTLIEFQSFLATAKPGDTITYHTGNLAYDKRKDKDLQNLARLAERDFTLFLSRKRLGDCAYQYRATKISHDTAERLYAISQSIKLPKRAHDAGH